MILFFGTRQGKSEIQHLDGLTCPYCSHRNTLSAAKTSSWFHLFWIKLFRVAEHIVIECSHCKRAYFKEAFTTEMEQALGKTRN